MRSQGPSFGRLLADFLLSPGRPGRPGLGGSWPPIIRLPCGQLGVPEPMALARTI